MSATTTEEAIQKKLEERRRAQSLLEDLQQKSEEADEKLEKLRKEKEEIQKRKQAESAKVTERVLKEHAKAFCLMDDSESSSKRQKF